MVDRAKKVSELNALTSSSGNNLLLIVDSPGTANVETKKITVSGLFANVPTSALFRSNVTVLGNVSSSYVVSNGAYITSVNAATLSGNTVEQIYLNDAVSYANSVLYADDVGAVAFANSITTAMHFGAATDSTNRFIISSDGNNFTVGAYSGNNPQIYALTGTTVSFDLTNSNRVPFAILDSTNTAITDNLYHLSTDGFSVSSGSNAQYQTDGILYWQIPVSIGANTYYYSSNAAPTLFGDIIIKDIASL